MIYVQPFDIEDAIRHDVTGACNTCGGLGYKHESDCPASTYVADRDAMLELLRRIWRTPCECPIDGNGQDIPHAVGALLARFPETT